MKLAGSILLVLLLVATSLVSAAPIGIWIDATEIAALSASGASWNALLAEANRTPSAPDLSNQNDNTNITVLAKALVFAKTLTASYRTQVRALLEAAIDTEKGGRTLALGRELAAYVIAADLIDLRTYDSTFDNNKFRPWLRRTLTETLDGKTLQSTHEERPNNWGTHAGASRAAVAVYLGDTAELARTAQVFKGWLGDRSAYAGFSYGDLSWQCTSSAPVGVNPKDCVKSSHDIDGVLPDDQRRGGSFTWPPPKENYVYEALQGAIVQAYILYRAGYDVFNWSDQAIKRAFVWLDEEANYPADGDDTWQMPLVDYIYGTSYWTGGTTNYGKNMGWTDWTHSGSITLPGPVNEAPIVNVGLDQIANLSEGIDLSAVVTDESTPTLAWSKVSGPGTVTFDDSSAQATHAAFSIDGVYEIKLVADDGSLTGEDSLLVTVMDDTPTPVNAAPMVNAGADATINISGTLNLEATTTDDGLPDPPASLSYQWAKVSGPGTVTFGTAAALSTTATFSATGSYVLSFTADDGELTDTDNVTVTVDADPPTGVTHMETATGTSTSSNTVSSASIMGVDGDYYVAAITMRIADTVTGVSGLGLTWAELHTQCSGRGQAPVSVWVAQGFPTGDGTVTATLTSSQDAIAISVSRYTNVSPACATGSIASYNTNGSAGACSGGADSAAYSGSVSASASEGIIYAAIAIRNKTHTPGTGYTERTEIAPGSSGSVAGLAVMDAPFTSSGSKTVDGTLSGATDWSLVILEIH